MTTPHRCPLCQGTGVDSTILVSDHILNKKTDPCQGCEGTGIVWGPTTTSTPNQNFDREFFIPEPPKYFETPIFPLNVPETLQTTEASKQALIEKLKSWIKDLEEIKTDSKDDIEFCD